MDTKIWSKGPPQHPAYGALHGAGAGPVRELLALIGCRGRSPEAVKPVLTPVKLTHGLARTKTTPTSAPTAAQLTLFHASGCAAPMATHLIDFSRKWKD